MRWQVVRRVLGRVVMLAIALLGAVTLVVVLVAVVPPALGGAYRAWAQHVAAPYATHSPLATTGKH